MAARVEDDILKEVEFGVGGVEQRLFCCCCCYDLWYQWTF